MLTRLNTTAMFKVEIGLGHFFPQYFFLLNDDSVSLFILNNFTTGWPHSSRNKIPCVFPEFSLCYINFPCVIFMQKQLAQWIKATSLLCYYIQKYTNSFFNKKVWIIWSVSIVIFSKCLLMEGSRESCDPCNDQGFGTQKIWYVKIILCWANFADIFKVCFFTKMDICSEK